ncbi:MAG TPA: DUF1800 domain-containing protein, partial [Alphaproteobacteria bacterium]|nr:DUF1800 domain-containing protein [Alphaproteobacteria bacterium]
DFWFNHFNVFWPKGPDQIFTASYEYDVLRPHALGSFRALLGAVAHAPAMLFYLDNWQDTAPDSPFAQRVLQRRGKQLGINENYAREIMELHTLGVDGGYTQKDVTTLAYILTGWGLARGPAMADKAAFFFDPARHDFGDHVFLGKTVKGGGEGEIEHVLDMLAASPATAHHISYELARYFVADDPPASLVDKVTATYEKTGGNIATMLKVILYSPEFWDPHNAQNKFKPPLRFVVSALRASGVMPQGDTRALQGAIAGMGEPLYRCLTPNGYGDGNDQWLNSDGLLKRIAVAKSFARFFGPQTTATIEATMGNTWTPNTLATVADAPPRLQPALLIGSPEFLYY